MYSTRFLAAALLGMIWYSMTAAIRLLVLALFVVVAAPFIIVMAGIEAGKQSRGPSRQPAIAVGIFASIGAAALYPILLAGFNIYLLATFLTAPVLGFKKGWSEGFVGIGRGGLMYLPLEDRIPFLQRTQARRPAVSVERENADIERATMDSIQEQVRVSNNPPITSESFALLKLTSQDYAALKAARLPPLSITEMQKIRDIRDPDISEALAAYEERKAYLEKGVCGILMDKPNVHDAILLVKQYQVGEKWLAVPGQSWIFDRDSLRDSCTKGAYARGQNPVNRDNIVNPPKYDGRYETRYRFHPFYAGTERLSEEFNQRISFLMVAISPTGSIMPDQADDDDSLRSDMVPRRM